MPPLETHTEPTAYLIVSRKPFWGPVDKGVAPWRQDETLLVSVPGGRTCLSPYRTSPGRVTHESRPRKCLLLKGSKALISLLAPNDSISMTGVWIEWYRGIKYKFTSTNSIFHWMSRYLLSADNDCLHVHYCAMTCWLKGVKWAISVWVIQISIMHHWGTPFPSARTYSPSPSLTPTFSITAI